MPLQRLDFAFRALCVKRLTNLIAAKRLVILAGLLTFSIQTTSANSETTPQRVISLSPHITEMLFSAGAGHKLVGVVDYSNYPEAALEIENIGAYNAIKIEKVIQLQPDLIIAWQSANRPKDIEKLQKLGFTVIFSHPKKLEDIPKEIRAFGKQLNTSNQANITAKQLENQLLAIKQRYQSEPIISAFYQIWNAPLMTINGQQFLSQALKLCAAKNVFADLPMLAAEVNIESVINRNPDTILIGGEQQMQQAWLNDWQKWKTLKAVQNRQIHLLEADTFQRPTQRFIEGIDKLCQTIMQARNPQSLND